MSIIYVLRDLVPFVQWRSVTFSKVVGLLKATLLHGRFSRFLNCTNGTKLRETSHLGRCQKSVAEFLFLLK